MLMFCGLGAAQGAQSLKTSDGKEYELCFVKKDNSEVIKKTDQGLLFEQLMKLRRDSHIDRNQDGRKRSVTLGGKEYTSIRCFVDPDGKIFTEKKDKVLFDELKNLYWPNRSNQGQTEDADDTPEG